MARRKGENDPERLAGLLRGRHLVEPPEAAVHRAVALRTLLPAGREGLAARIVRVLFDSALSAAPAGVRAGASSERRVLFELRDDAVGAAPTELDLRVRVERGGTYEIAGQLLPPREGATVVVRAGRTRRSEPLGELGDFVLQRVPARGGRVELEIAWPGAEPFVIADVPPPAGPR